MRHHSRTRRAASTRVQDQPSLPAHRQDARRRAVRSTGQYDRHAGARASQSPGDRGRQARVERKADRQYAGRRPGNCRFSQEKRRANLGCTDRRRRVRNSPSWPRHSPPARSAASPPPMPHYGHTGPTLVVVLLRRGRREPSRSRRLQPHYAHRPLGTGPRRHRNDQHRHSHARDRQQGHRSKSPKKTTQWS